MSFVKRSMNKSVRIEVGKYETLHFFPKEIIINFIVDLNQLKTSLIPAVFRHDLIFERSVVICYFSQVRFRPLKCHNNDDFFH